MAELFTEEGAKAVITARGKDKLEEVVNIIRENSEKLSA